MASRQGVIIEWALNGQFHDADTNISEMLDNDHEWQLVVQIKR